MSTSFSSLVKSLLVCVFRVKTAYYKTRNNQIRPELTRNQSRIKQNLSAAVHFLFRIMGPPAVAGRVLWNRVCPSCLFRLSGSFLGIVLLFFSESWDGNRNFKLEKLNKNGPKTGFFEFIEQFSHEFFLNLFYNENLFYLLCSCTNPIFGKIFVSDIRAKMISATQIAGIFNQQYLQNKSFK